MKWIGLTGGIATGKSTVSKFIRDFGLPVVDADQLAREALAPGGQGLADVVKIFGESILDKDGALNREILGDIIFSEPQKREQLERIVHPLIQDLRLAEKNRLENQGESMAFYDVPLLFEKNLQGEFDKVVLVYAPEGLQRSRLADRNGFMEDEIAKRLNSQMPIDEKKAMADFVIVNTGSLTELKHQVKDVLVQLQSENPS